MTLTRKQSVAVFEKVLTDFFNASNADHPIRLSLALAGDEDIHDLVTMSEKDIEDLTPDGSRSLDKGNTRRVMIFYHFYEKLVAENANLPLDFDQWSAVAKDEFDKFRLIPAEVIKQQLQQAAKQTASNTTTTSIQTEISNFKRGIKRDMSVYPVLKDMKSYDSWYRTVRSTAKAHDVDEVFDPHYVPQDVDESKLFELK